MVVHPSCSMEANRLVMSIGVSLTIAGKLAEVEILGDHHPTSLIRNPKCYQLVEVHQQDSLHLNLCKIQLPL